MGRRAAMVIVERDLGYARITRALRDAKGRGVRVGFVEGETHDGGAATLATIAAVHEYGVEMTVSERQAGFMIGALDMGHVKAGDTLRIPARPVFRAAVDEAETRIMRTLIVEMLNAAAEKHEDPVGFALGRAGLRGTAAIQAGYTHARDHVEPLSEVTLREREKRSVGSGAPLIDTGQLRASVRHVVEPRPPAAGGAS